VLGLLASLGMRWRYRRYVEINRALEARIVERTAELETANAKLAELATEDTLTGIANRRALEQALNREWDRCRELGQPLAVIMVDVDHFKQFNDRHGHLAGDQHLIGVAAVLKKHARPVRELLARFGGEEFVLVLPGLDAAAASERAERLRHAVEQDLPGTTISAGVAAEVPREQGEGPTGIVRRADTALYRAKRKGRNRVEIDD
jgi:diguanylate cyclase (GGDEF)-like protein